MDLALVLVITLLLGYSDMDVLSMTRVIPPFNGTSTPRPVSSLGH